MSADYLSADYDRVHCKHGNFIGYPGGADYMCGYCEDGVEPPSAADIAQRQARRVESAAEQFDHLTSIVADSIGYWHPSYVSELEELADGYAQRHGCAREFRNGGTP